jgi:ribulose-phosphate 3-epimerase
LQEIRDLGILAGLAINPASSVESIEPCLPYCDLVLVMSVEAGFGGQRFQPSAIEKLRKLRETRERNFLLEVDGGINSKTIAECGAAGAELFVVGSAIFGENSYRPIVEELTRIASV